MKLIFLLSLFVQNISAEDSAPEITNKVEFLNYSSNFFNWLHNDRFIHPLICSQNHGTPTDENDWRVNPNQRPILIRSRESWGALPLVRDDESFNCINYLSNLETFAAFRGKPESKLSLRDIYDGGRIVIHHTASNIIDIEDMDESAINIKKLVTIDYHFIIDTEGIIYEGRPLFLAGANAGAAPEKMTCKDDQRVRDFNRDYDFRSIGIALYGLHLDSEENEEYLRVEIRTAKKKLRAKTLSRSDQEEARRLGIDFVGNKYSESGISKIIEIILAGQRSLYSFLPSRPEAAFILQNRSSINSNSKQYQSLKFLVKKLNQEYGLNKITGHKHVRHGPTVCPGQALLDLLRADFNSNQSPYQVDYYDHPDFNDLLPPLKCVYKAKRCSTSWCDNNPNRCQRVQVD